MKNSRKAHWEKTVKSMSRINQLELAKIIAEELEPNKLVEILDKFSQLSIQNQSKVIETISSEVVRTLEKEELDRKKMECEKSGEHTFDDWYTCITHFGPSQDAIARNNDYRTWSITTWVRHCQNCDYKEESRIEPEEIRLARIKKHNK